MFPLISAIAQAGAGFYLHAPQFVAAFHHEVVAMHLSVGLADNVAEAHGFVDEGYFSEVSHSGYRDAAGSGGLLGRASPGRWGASG